MVNLDGGLLHSFVFQPVLFICLLINSKQDSADRQVLVLNADKVNVTVKKVRFQCVFSDIYEQESLAGTFDEGGALLLIFSSWATVLACFEVFFTLKSGKTGGLGNSETIFVYTTWRNYCFDGGM